MPRTVVIVNPRSGGGRTGRRWPALRERLRAGYGTFDERITTAPGDATVMTRAALRGEDGSPPADTVLSLGGDGTLNEVVNGFFDRGEAISPSARLGLLAAGTGGDFRRTLELPLDLEAAGRALAGAEAVSVDAGLIRHLDAEGHPAERYFINIAAFGIGGLIDRYVNRSSKALGGTLSFALATLRAGLSWRNPAVRLRLDGGPATEIKIYNVAVANGRYFGGGMKVAPEADLGDGLFDVVVMGDMSFAELITSGHRIYSGSHVTHPKVRVDRARLVEAEPVDPGAEILIDCDGEQPGRLPARFEILPAAIRLLRPR